jgi:cobalt/nickel transport system permease protein
MAPHVKIAAAFTFVFAVVATPREAIWAFGIYAGFLAILIAVAGLRPRFVLTRMVVEIPFVLATLLFPFLAGGPTIEVLGVELSRAGLWDMWNILAKATLGLLTSIVLAGTTEIPRVLAGFDALRVPRVITAIMGFMIRYLDVVLGEFRRMRVAMQSRAYAPRWLGHVRPYAQSAGTIFVRSYERGERVYLAMASRGYTGHMPPATVGSATAAEWATGAAFVTAAWAIAIIAWVVQ